MIDKWLSKSKLNYVINNFVKKFLFEKINANQLTILGLIIGILSAISIFLSGILIWELELIICAAILMIISFFFDVLQLSQIPSSSSSGDSSSPQFSQYVVMNVPPF